MLLLTWKLLKLGYFFQVFIPVGFIGQKNMSLGLYRNIGIETSRRHYQQSSFHLSVGQCRAAVGTKRFNVLCWFVLKRLDVIPARDSFDGSDWRKQIRGVRRARIFSAPLAMAKKEILKIAVLLMHNNFSFRIKVDNKKFRTIWYKHAISPGLLMPDFCPPPGPSKKQTGANNKYPLLSYFRSKSKYNFTYALVPGVVRGYDRGRLPLRGPLFFRTLSDWSFRLCSPFSPQLWPCFRHCFYLLCTLP